MKLKVQHLKILFSALSVLAVIYYPSNHAAYIAVFLAGIFCYEELRKNKKNEEEKFFAIFEKAPFAIALMNYPGVEIVDVNPAFEELFSLKRENIVGLSTAKLGIHQDFKERESVLENFARNGTIRNIERRFTSRSGKEVVVLNNVDKIVLSGKVYILSTMEDITERKQLLENLFNALKTRDDFLSIASHELKTPLTFLKLQAEFKKRKLEKGTLTLEELNKVVDGELNQINRLHILIEDMLDISRLNTGKLSIQTHQFELGSLVNEVVEKCRPHFEASHVEIHVDQSEPVIGTWDHFRIDQVITNLLTNALKYGGGKPVKVSVTKSHDKAVISVSDEGIGIAPENHSRIFDRFERAVTYKEARGLGLGLFIVKQIVEMHKGAIRVESELGKGASFIVELPLEGSD